MGRLEKRFNTLSGCEAPSTTKRNVKCLNVLPGGGKLC